MDTPKADLDNYRRAVRQGRIQAGIISCLIIISITIADWAFEWRENSRLKQDVQALTRENALAKSDDVDKKQKTVLMEQTVSNVLKQSAETSDAIKKLEGRMAIIKSLPDQGIDLFQRFLLNDATNNVRLAYTKLDNQIQALKSTNKSSPRTALNVFITNTGLKYHRFDCEYLSQSRTAINLSEAIAKGYKPCGKCNPPKEED